MALGKRQLETLQTYTDRLKAQPTVLKLQINIHRWRPYTREFGKGYLISISPYECYEEGEYKMRGVSLANCTEHYTVEDKAKELARYLVDTLGCPKDRVRIRRVLSML